MVILRISWPPPGRVYDKTTARLPFTNAHKPPDTSTTLAKSSVNIIFHHRPVLDKQRN